jgi:hypothetical protein
MHPDSVREPMLRRGEPGSAASPHDTALMEYGGYPAASAATGEQRVHAAGNPAAEGAGRVGAAKGVKDHLLFDHLHNLEQEV